MNSATPKTSEHFHSLKSYIWKFADPAVPPVRIGKPGIRVRMWNSGFADIGIEFYAPENRQSTFIVALALIVAGR